MSLELSRQPKLAVRQTDEIPGPGEDIQGDKKRPNHKIGPSLLLFKLFYANNPHIFGKCNHLAGFLDMVDMAFIEVGLCLWGKLD